MEKTGAIEIGVTPELKEPEKQGCACCNCPRRKTREQRIEELEDDTTMRLAKAASKQE